jgi:hypothetical protein
MRSLRLTPPVEAIASSEFADAGLWNFESMSWSEIDAFLRQTPLTPAQLSILADPAIRMELEEGSIRQIRVSPEVRIGLSPQSRNAIYSELAKFHSNFATALPLMLPEPSLIEKARLNPRLREVLSKISYPRGDRFYVTDTDVLAPFVEDNDERMRLDRLLMGIQTLQVEITTDSLKNKSETLHYWNKSQGKSITSVLRILESSPGLESINLANLLPLMPQAILNQFPDDRTIPWDANCFWASLNFFAREASPKYLPSFTATDEALSQAVNTLSVDYDQVQPPYAFGDVLCMVPVDDPPDHITLLHMMVHIAGNIVFTKNGYSATRPFVLMTREDVMTHYSWSTPVKLRGFRRKTSPPSPIEGLF